MHSVFFTIWTKFLEFNSFWVVFLIFFACIISVFAFHAFQSNIFSHDSLLKFLTKNIVFVLAQKKEPELLNAFSFKSCKNYNTNILNCKPFLLKFSPIIIYNIIFLRIFLYFFFYYEIRHTHLNFLLK